MSVRHWGVAGVKPPSDSLSCSNCSSSNTVRDALLITFFLLIGIIIIIVVIAVCYIRWQRYGTPEEELSWKIRYDELHFLKQELNSLKVQTQSMSKTTMTSYPMLNIAPAESSLGHVGAAYCRGVLCAVKFAGSKVLTFTKRDQVELGHMRSITHDNLCLFIGVCNEPGHVSVLSKFCLRGSLQDVLLNSDIKLDDNFKRSFICDCIQGLDYLHKSPIKSHGRMRSPTCLVDSRWVIKLSSWGLSTVHKLRSFDNEEERYSVLLWTAPELLNNPNPPLNGTPLADIYSLGIVIQEILYRCPPYQSGGEPPRSNKEIVLRVKNTESPPFRPKLLEDPNIDSRYLDMSRDCLAEDKNMRPLTSRLLTRFNSFNKGKVNIMDNILKMMEKYANNLEEIIGERTMQLEEEKKKADLLLYRMLPSSVADSLKSGLPIHPEMYKEATIYFSDIVSFTTLASESSPMEVVDFLNDLWTTFDDIINKYNVYKVETIGDAYLVVSGVPAKCDRHAGEIADMSLDILEAVKSFKISHKPERQLKIRIGMHSGPVVAGVVGQTMPRYCLFGDTVNMASRMESHGLPLKIHISGASYNRLGKLPDGYIMELRGEMEIKGKGLQLTYFLEGKKGGIPRPRIAPITVTEVPVITPVENVGKNYMTSSITDISKFATRPVTMSNI